MRDKTINVPSPLVLWPEGLCAKKLLIALFHCLSACFVCCKYDRLNAALNFYFFLVVFLSKNCFLFLLVCFVLTCSHLCFSFNVLVVYHLFQVEL